MKNALLFLLVFNILNNFAQEPQNTIFDASIIYEPFQTSFIKEIDEAIEDLDLIKFEQSLKNLDRVNIHQKKDILNVINFNLKNKIGHFKKAFKENNKNFFIPLDEIVADIGAIIGTTMFLSICGMAYLGEKVIKLKKDELERKMDMLSGIMFSPLILGFYYSYIQGSKRIFKAKQIAKLISDEIIKIENAYKQMIKILIRLP